MPNGTSGGFMIGKDRLRSILERYPGSKKIANPNEMSGTASEVLEALESFPMDEVVVTEVDGEDYIVRLAPSCLTDEWRIEEVSLWFTVDEESPIFVDLLEELRRSLGPRTKDSPSGPE